MSCSQYGDNYPLTSRDNYRLTEIADSSYFLDTMRTFKDALLEITENTGISLKQVAEGAGVSYEQLKKLKQNKTKNTNVEDARKIAAYFNKPLEEFIEGSIRKDEVDLAIVLGQLSPSDRQFLLNAAKAQIDAKRTSQD